MSNVSSDSIAAPQIRLLNDPGPVLQARFGKAPPPGVHPRVLISPEQLPSLQRLLQSTVTGKFVLAKLESYLDNLHVPGKPLAAAYDHLAAGDPAAYSYAASESWKGYVFFAVSMECYDAMIRQDESRGKRAGAALATLAKITKGWSNNDSDLANFALGYDYDYGYMTDEERTIVRQTISGATYGKKLPSADLPPDWRDNNSIPRGIVGQFLSALAIEGEKGYDPSIYPSSLGIMKDFLHFGITQTGGPLEEMHYFHYGMQLGSLAMVACARRGDNLFAEPRYRALANWLIASMEPFGDAFSMHQDTPNDQGGLATNYAIMKWVWPDDATLDMVWRNRIRPDYDGLSYFGDWSAPLLFPSDPKGWPLYSGKSPQSKWGINEVAPPPPAIPTR